MDKMTRADDANGINNGEAIDLETPFEKDSAEAFLQDMEMLSHDPLATTQRKAPSDTMDAGHGSATLGNQPEWAKPLKM